MVRKGSTVRVRQRALAGFAGIFGRLGSASGRPEGPLRVHRAARRSNLVLCWDTLAVPVLDDSGVVLLDHAHARPNLLGDLGERHALVHAQRHKARAQVPWTRARGSAARTRRCRSLAVSARSLGLAMPHAQSPIAPVIRLPEPTVVRREHRRRAPRPAAGQDHSRRSSANVGRSSPGVGGAS